ncbi:hypothetical protein GCM10027516_41480 [Niabella aquatica]
MGLAYTIDTPIKVAPFGISSVLSICDDELIEKMRAFYSSKFELPYEEISRKIHDYRAKRITQYLNMVDIIVKKKFQIFKKELTESRKALEHYIAMLSNKSEFKKCIQNFIKDSKTLKEQIENYIEEHLCPGKIDVNIMTKVDKDNFENDKQLPIIYNDAHASLRGFANSTLDASVVLSAGMNPRLYSYFENFGDFYPDQNDHLKKKITLKVSDYRSAFIQSSFLAKKGLWVSEYRIESGLNCGGHAFATEGLLMGPILKEFREKKEELILSAHRLMTSALKDKGLPVPTSPLPLKITAQGGVGTAAEHSFLLEHYKLDSIGWGSPFLLVPEATTVDAATRELLCNAREDAFYLSNISPLGVPFNSVKGVSNDFWKQKRIDDNKAGSACPKKFLSLSKEYGNQGICTASKKYQDIKLAELETEKNLIPATEYQKRRKAVTDKACLCVGLANAAYMENNIDIKGQAQGVVICPGPNLAYFDKQVSLATMTRHIYGNTNVLTVKNRPHMFINELKMYIDYFRKGVAELQEHPSASQIKKWNTFKNNMLNGIAYYKSLFSSANYADADSSLLLEQLENNQVELEKVNGRFL